METPQPLNLTEYEDAAGAVLPGPIFDFIAGGAEDEVTLRENRAAFERVQLRPRVLVDASQVSTRTELLGREMPLPMLLAPVALQRAAHPEGELAVARAAARGGVTIVLSTMSSYSIEDVAAAADGPKWFQLYCHPDREMTKRLVQRAEAAGYQAVCLTVDVPVLGRRERDLRNRLRFPPDVVPANFADEPSLITAPADESELVVWMGGVKDPALTWRDVEWLRSITSMPVLLKGVLTAEDAVLAVEHGAGGVIVSNHGGRQLDGVPAAIDALPEVAAAVQGRAAVLMDSGVRRGTDVLKALALGADAVLIGRPYVWALAAAGEPGVRRVISLLQDELESAMALAGCAGVGDITRRVVSVRNS